MYPRTPQGSDAVSTGGARSRTSSFFAQVPHLPGVGVSGEPVICGLYAAVAEEASAAFWSQRRAFHSARTTVSLADVLDELTRAFVEDLNWLTATQMLYPSYRSRRWLRVILFFDGMDSSAVEIVNWFLNHLLAASMSQNVVLVVACPP